MTEFTRSPILDDVRDRADPDLDDLAAQEPTSDLDDIASELTAEVTPTTTLPVEGRPGYLVTYRTNFTGIDLDNLRKKSKDRRFTEKLDNIKFAALLLASTCQGIIRNGLPLNEALGETQAATFTSRALQELYGTTDAQGTVRKFYGLEGQLDACARKLMTEAGWGDTVDAADPTV